jgi:hypothetical protein
MSKTQTAVGGRKYWLNGWTKKTKDGKRISLSLKPKDHTAPKTRDVGFFP